jgi:uncharacterized protein (UPF0332 family)
MVSTMKPHKEILAQIAIEKAEEALKTSYDNIDISLFVAQNRAYYAVFYAVSALAYLDDFVTKSHHKLMGQFNKRYIHQEKIFNNSLSKIYSTLILNRESTDYDFTAKPVKEHVLKNIEAAKIFINTVKPYVLKRLNENDY